MLAEVAKLYENATNDVVRAKLRDVLEYMIAMRDKEPNQTERFLFRQEGSKLQAMKQYKERIGCGYMEAKQTLEQYQ